MANDESEFEIYRQLTHADLDGVDLEAFRFVRSWHRFPALQEALWYKGVNLGEMGEHALLEAIIAILHTQSGEGSA